MEFVHPDPDTLLFLFILQHECTLSSTCYFRFSTINITYTLQLIKKSFFFFLRSCSSHQLWKYHASCLCSNYSADEATLWVIDIVGLKQGKVL